jgi:hypothetical protein
VPFRTRISLSLMTTSLASKHCFILRVCISSILVGMANHHQRSNISKESQLLTCRIYETRYQILSLCHSLPSYHAFYEFCIKCVQCYKVILFRDILFTLYICLHFKQCLISKHVMSHNNIFGDLHNYHKVFNSQFLSSTSLYCAL